LPTVGLQAFFRWHASLRVRHRHLVSSPVQEEGCLGDAHTHLLWVERIRARALLIDIDQREIFERTIKYSANPFPAACLDAWDQFLYLGLHALKHNVLQLLWLVDI
jgi:hypothetical protein